VSKKQTIFKVVSVIGGNPTLEKPLNAILSQLELGGGLEVLDPLKCHTAHQRAWVKCVAIPTLADWSGYTEEWWDDHLKKECKGAALLKKQTYTMADGTIVTRFTIIGVGKRNLTKYIQEIIDKAIEMGWPLDAPEKDLRK